MKVCNVGISVCIALGTLFFSMPMPISGAIDRSSIVAIWLFDEGGGEVARDSSENGNDAELFDAPEWVEGRSGEALRFDGGTDYVAAPDSQSLDIGGDQLSIVAWVKGEGWPAPDNNFVVRKISDEAMQHVYTLRAQPETAYVILKTEAGESRISGKTALPTDEWVHLAMVYDSQEVRIYVNGELDGSAPVAGKITQSDNELRIARGDPGGYFRGTIDEVAIFASALTAVDVQGIMKTGLGELLSPVEPADKLTITWASIKAQD